MKRILATDFDGTICFHDGSDMYHPEDMEAILRFQKNGNLVGINSGRCVNYMENIEAVPCPIKFDFFCGDTGAMLADADRKMIKGWPLTWEVIDKYLSRKTGKAERILSADGNYFKFRTDNNLFHVPMIDNLAELREMTPYSFSLEFEDLPSTGQALRDVFFDAEELNVAQNWNSLDCVRADRGKGAVLYDLANWAGVSIEQISAIGDGLNDLDAIREAGTGFAMSWAPEELKKEADYVVDSIAQAIEILEKLDEESKEQKRER